MKSMYVIRRLLLVAAVCLGSVAGLAPVFATDGNPILELGTFSWLDFQKKKLTAEVAEIKIQGRAVQSPQIDVSLYQAIIFENADEKENHRLVFPPGLDNTMDRPYKSPVIKPGERWGLELHNLGVFTYRCTLHPEESGTIKVHL